jgi:hypothetical protein
MLVQMSESMRVSDCELQLPLLLKLDRWIADMFVPGFLHRPTRPTKRQFPQGYEYLFVTDALRSMIEKIILKSALAIETYMIVCSSL